MSLDQCLQAWENQPEIRKNIPEWRRLPARPAETVPIPNELHPDLRASLDRLGISQLYSHQAEAFEKISAGNNVIVVTGTASGKTLCYNLPVVNRLYRQPQACAIYLFPTKALAQDQLANLARLSSLPAGIYDGDTPAHSRSQIRASARILLSNPDMLHAGILPRHTSWAHFFACLEFVVLDEVHIYRGVFGSHIANVIRRLQRITNHYGAHPQYILTSATIANPAQHAAALIEKPFVVVNRDGSARGPRHFLVYNPPLIDPSLGLRKSALQEAVRLTDDLQTYQAQTILFARSRRSVEIALTYLRGRAGQIPSDESTGIQAYRGGFLPDHRRSVERGLRDGQVRAVVATNALELGIDIGQMEASILIGYPGSISSTWQQAGRAGRGDEPALAMLIATADPLDQFLASHPDYLFERSVEHALINPDNLLILLDHIRCAAYELPFRTGETFGAVEPARVAEILDFLVESGSVMSGPEISGVRQYLWSSEETPSQAISLRSASVERILLLAASPNAEPRLIGQVDGESAAWLVHPGAVYLHNGQTYLVDSLNREQQSALLHIDQTDFYTEPRSQSTLELVERRQSAPVAGGEKASGEIRITTLLTGYRKIRWYTHEPLGDVALDMPPSELQTGAYWLTLADETVELLRQRGMWTNDPNQYGPNWRTQRERVRARDSYRCTICGIPEAGRQHDVHHKIPFRTFASYETANQMDNLITVCPSCHRRVETAVRVRSGLGGLGYVLHSLAPLFLMCDRDDIGVHTDPQSPLSEGRPTVVIYERAPAGIGFSDQLYEIHVALINACQELVAACACQDGCPSCVGPGGENGLGSRAETLAILEALAPRLDGTIPA
jgi:DEAD/DEAH box helicase domain-containing protein